MAKTTGKFDIYEPFANKGCLNEVLKAFEGFQYKLYNKIPIKFYRGKPTVYEFDLNLGIMHFTEMDFMGLSAIFEKINLKWGTKMTYCIYPSRESNRDMIINIRGSPKAPSELG